mgnify:CR=1 FL=1
MKVELSDWIVVEDYCALRIIKNSDPEKIENRVAFIEKTPRIRVGEFTNRDEDFKNWEQGDKGSGGSGDHEALGQYGFDPDSRAWCDEELIKLGYIIK